MCDIPVITCLRFPVHVSQSNCICIRPYTGCSVFVAVVVTSAPGNEAELQLYRVMQRASLLAYYDTLLEMGQSVLIAPFCHGHCVCVCPPPVPQLTRLEPKFFLFYVCLLTYNRVCAK